MINLSRSREASPAIHEMSSDPGVNWDKWPTVAIEAAPDDDASPHPESRWAPEAIRTGVCGSVSPRVVVLPGGRYRMYYSQLLPRPGFPAGANDYDNAMSRILSAVSEDGLTWSPEPGVRLGPQQGGAGDFRVVSSEVVPLSDGSGCLRMYYECCRGSQTTRNSINSALSDDEGLKWQVETGERLGLEDANLSGPRIVYLEDGRCRLYVSRRGTGIISAISSDGGTTFEIEPGVRIAQSPPLTAHAAFAPEIIRRGPSDYRMYFAAYSTAERTDILTAESADGLDWTIQAEPVLSPGGGGWDDAKSSEMCVFELPDSTAETPRFAMVYEGCDGTAVGVRGVWRVVCAVSAPR